MPPNKLNYIPLIDGLRSIAVLAVVVFHFFPTFLKGGYIGVDIFFVISGYLVTGISLRKIQNESFSFVDFYKRRIARLLPSLLIVLSVSLIFSYYFLLSEEFKNVGLHIFSGTFFFSNILFFTESGYFDQSSELKPFLHLWSLSLEEQFYFIWPFILFVCYKFSKNYKSSILKTSLLIICFISLVSCIALSKNNQSLTFYNLPFRLWELGFGGILSLYHFTNTINNDQYNRKMKYLSYIGLIFILTSIVFFSHKTLFPGYSALLPVLGTCLIILSINVESRLSRFLQKPLLIYIGKLSYPLYLWHWPIFSFAFIITGGNLSLSLRFALLFLTFVLSILTFEFIEKRITFRSRNAITLLCLINITIGLIGIFVFKKDGLPNRYPAHENLYLSKKSFTDSIVPNRKSPFCEKNFNKIEICLLQDETKFPTIALIGDSHANHWFPGLIKKFNHSNLLLLAKSGTVPLIDVKSKRNPDTELNNEFSYIFMNKNIHTVILSAFWSNYFEKEGTFVAGSYYKNSIYSASSNETDQNIIFVNQFEKTIQEIQKYNKKIIFFYDIPSLDFELESCLSRPLINKYSFCEYKIKNEVEKQKGYRQAIDQILHKYKISTFDPFKLICNDVICNISINNQFLYSDSHHLSIFGSQKIIDSSDFKL